MNASLRIAIEAHWHGSMLEVVRPVAALELHSTADLAGLLTVGEPFKLHLTNGEPVTVWCARTAIGRYIIEVKSESRTLLRTEADAPITAQAFLPDGKQYMFSIRVEP